MMGSAYLYSFIYLFTNNVHSFIHRVDILVDLQSQNMRYQLLMENIHTYIHT